MKEFQERFLQRGSGAASGTNRNGPTERKDRVCGLGKALQRS